MWATEVSSYVPLEKIAFCLKKRQDLFVKHWDSFLSYMGITIAGQKTKQNYFNMTLNAFFLFTLFMVLVALWEGGLGCDIGL